MNWLDTTPTDPLALRQAFSCFPSGVTTVCGLDAGTPVGMAASTFTPVSLAPSLVSVCVQRTSKTWPRISRLRRMGVSVLAEGQDAICRSLASKEGDRFANVDWEADGDGSVYIRGAALWLSCSKYTELPAGDHTIVLLKIHGLEIGADQSPLVFHGSQYRRLAVSNNGHT